MIELLVTILFVLLLMWLVSLLIPLVTEDPKAQRIAKVVLLVVAIILCLAVWAGEIPLLPLRR